MTRTAISDRINSTIKIPRKFHQRHFFWYEKEVFVNELDERNGGLIRDKKFVVGEIDELTTVNSSV